MTLKPQTGSAGGTSTLSPFGDTRELLIFRYGARVRLQYPSDRCPNPSASARDMLRARFASASHVTRSGQDPQKRHAVSTNTIPDPLQDAHRTTKESDIRHSLHRPTPLRTWSAPPTHRERSAHHSLRPQTSGTARRCSPTHQRVNTAPAPQARDGDRDQLEDLARAPKGVYNNIIIFSRSLNACGGLSIIVTAT